MRHLLSLLIVTVVALAATAQSDPPGMIVIRPKPKAETPPKAPPAPGSTGVSQQLPTPRPVIVEESKEKPGFLVIRPRNSNSTPLANADQFIPIRPAGAANRTEPNHYGSVTIVRPKGNEPVPANRAATGGLPSPFVNAQPPAAAGSPMPPPQAPKIELPADPSQGKIVRETWDAVFVDKMHIGYVHTLVRQFAKDGQTFLYAIKELRQTVKRFDQRVEMWEEETTFETPAGQVLIYRRKQGVGRNQVLAITGQVSGKSILLKGEGAAAGMDDTVPWPDGVIGIAKEASLMTGRVTKPGETISYQMFAGQVNWVAKYTITVKGNEAVALYAGEAPRTMTKVEVAMDPIRDKQGAVFSLPVQTVWHDAVTGEALKAEFDMPPLGGQMTVVRTTKEAASRAPGQVPELFNVQSIRLDRRIDRIHQQSSVTYRVNASKDPDPKTMFVRDERQSVANPNPESKLFTLIITVPPQESKAEAAKAEYLKECLDKSFYIDWDNDLVRKLAQEAVAQKRATETLDKAKAVEQWVRTNMKSAEFSQAMASCTATAKSLTGDCTEFSMLACGMCRSLGIPARTALGLVYAPDREGNPYLAFHMWYEVYADGRWVGLDGTLAMGRIGTGHIKITDANWHNETSMAPLLPVLRVLMARPTFEVLKVQ